MEPSERKKFFRFLSQSDQELISFSTRLPRIVHTESPLPKADATSVPPKYPKLLRSSHIKDCDDVQGGWNNSQGIGVLYFGNKTFGMSLKWWPVKNKLCLKKNSAKHLMSRQPRFDCVSFVLTFGQK